MFYYTPDSYYILLVLPALLISLICQANIKSTYKRCDRILNSRGLTGAAAAQAVLSYYGIYNVSINCINGKLTDHYDPRTNCINLSTKVYNGTSVAAVGIACHEAGHAAQHAENYAPIRVRNSILPIANIGSYAGIILCLIGYMLGFGLLAYVGIGLFSFVFLFQLVTLPVEFNASHRALSVIDEVGLLTHEERNGARKVLAAAAMTYVAATLVALANLIRIIARFGGKNRR